MSRIFLYKSAFIISLILFGLDILLAPSFRISTLVSPLFALSTFMLIFSKETIAKENLEIPSIFRYQNERTNTYGYIMAFAGSLSAFVFFISTTYFKLDPIVVSLALWFVLILVVTFAERRTQYDQDFNILTDYIMQFRDDHFKELTKVQVSNIVKTLVLNPEGMEAIAKELEVDLKTLTKIEKLVVKFIKESTVEITSEEVDALQKRKQ